MPKESLTLPPDIHPPTRYVEKVNLVTGEVLDEPILPKHLLINNHRDFHILDIYSRYLIGRAVERTGDPPKVLRKMKKVRRLGQKAVELLSTVVGEQADFIGKKLFGYKAKEYFFRYRSSELSEAEAEARIQGLREEAQKRLDRCKEGDRLALRVLLTGGTGFLGKEIICQAAEDPEIDEMYILIRPKEIRDRNTKKVLQVLSPTERGAILLRQLWLENHPARGKFRFIDGDIEKPDLGIHSADLDQIRARVTHVIHCAASVSFDDTYENSFRANVRGALNAAELSSRLWASAGSRFVCHVAIETSYIHGRQTGTEASEGNMVFPRNFFNNYYEVTKAMGSMETDWYMLDHGLPVTQLCPSIVVGHSRNGNNRGDTKVVNAPVNAFGRAQQALRSETGSWSDRSKAHVLASIACVFPADRSAELNLVSVDRVSAGILAALKTTAVIGTRTHLATDNRLTSAAIQRIAKEEVVACRPGAWSSGPRPIPGSHLLRPIETSEAPVPENCQRSCRHRESGCSAPSPDFRGPVRGLSPVPGRCTSGLRAGRPSSPGSGSERPRNPPVATPAKQKPPVRPG